MKLFGLILSVLFLAQINAEKRCSIDVIAVLDGSDSITDGDYVKLKNAVKKLAEWLSSDDDTQRLGAVVYSSSVTDYAPLSSDVMDLKQRISNFDHPKEGTWTHLGINKMKEMFDAGTRARVPQVGIVITDGRSKYPVQTASAAAAAKTAGIRMIAVGIGHLVNTTELATIASTQKDVKTISNFDQLQAVLADLVEKFCVVDGNWSDWSHTDGQCSVTCGQGLITTTSTRTCTNPAPRNRGKYCEGPATTTSTKTCTKKECLADPCAGCRYENGVGYMPHKGDCRLFLQCIDYGKSYKIMNCPDCLYWNQEHLTCDRSRVMCSSTIPQAECVQDSGDEPAFRGCDGSVRLSSSGLSYYEERVPGHDWVRRLCPSGTRYNSSTCTCEHGGVVYNQVCTAELFIPFTGDVSDRSGKHVVVDNLGVKVTSGNAGNFRANTGLRINRFSNMDFGDTLIIDFMMYNTYRTTTRGQAIVTNAQCEEHGTFYIIGKGNRIEFRVYDTLGKSYTLYINYSRTSTYSHVKLSIENGRMTATVNGVTKSRDFKNNIAKAHCALHIGQGTNYDNFIGLIDDFKLYICHP